MSIEILGVLLHRNVSETSPPGGPKFDLDAIGDLARAYDENGYDRVLILQNSFAPDPFAIASYTAAITQRLKFMIAHRPGFIAPTMAARMFATLDHLSGGRAGVHVITGANDKELLCDGDRSTKERRYLRSREYVEIMRRVWSADTPFEFKGDYYDVEGALSELRPVNGSVPIYWGGMSPLALEKGGECADVFALGGLMPLAQQEKWVQDIQAAAAKAGRDIRVQTSARLIVGETEEEAWKKAHSIADQLKEIALVQKAESGEGSTAVRAGMRLDKTVATTKGGAAGGMFQDIVNGPDMLDDRLWTGLTKATIDFSTPTIPPVLVGSAEQVADALLAYYRIGISGFLIRGFDLLGDIADYGQGMIPILRDKVSTFDSQSKSVASHAGAK
jgi:alkanesulfonate monooxygenase